eukprot:CAMPEP_0197831550 /NCGR_PEP_ID=MMETSP1437-20131217/10755_1 /TAXON_ID=49252 ORGANISM="Eucampia antarctica, Strain CCMP1452" /NCGR_SAMPLE_ID=MMETSP1437 /ASSEMBLY_ACC=CAM_ASM_001096 /LENGTH=701 /DNA_ID=CAMNT_0043434507 /DNA_START=168 /DNA_END=2273 /DNA_ORIENTATION=+
MENYESTVSANLVASTGIATLVFASGLAYVMMKKGSRNDGDTEISVKEEEEVPPLDKSVFPGGHLTVYFGTQTGTAESFSQQIEREGEANGFKVQIVDLEDISEDVAGNMLSKLTRDDTGKNKAIFLMSTYGEGEPTDNAARVIRLLWKKSGLKGPNSDATEDEEEKKTEEDVTLDPTYLKGLDYAVFGLGNKQYQFFNAMGKAADSSLEKVGANKILEIGLGDDDDDLEADFDNWKDNIMWPALKKKYVDTLGSDNASKLNTVKKKKEVKLPPCHISVEYITSNQDKVDEISLNDVHSSSKHYFSAVDCPVTLKRELRSPEDGGSTLHMEIDISNSGGRVKYQTADNLGVLPVNSDAVVEAVASALEFDLDATFRLKAAPGQDSKHASLFPSPITVRECLSRYCNLTSAPRRSELKLLAAYAKDPIDKSALLRMASKEGKNEYREKILNAQIGLVDIVSKLCRSIRMPLEHFISVCPRLQTRYYTISSSSSCHPQSIHATVAITKTERSDGSIFKGVCSNHLADTSVNNTVRVFCRDSTFRLPSDPSTPIIMIGPGTGVAPMRALLQERSYMKLEKKLIVGPNVLYFGCKKRALDYLYEEEIEQFQKDGVLTQYHVAFSREQKEKVYVQNLLAKNAKETWKLINDLGAYVYVCGGVKMGGDVSITLRAIVSDMGEMSSDDAKNYLDKMTSKGRYIQELWA